MKKYQPQQFESKWTAQWEKEQTYKTPNSVGKKGKKYILDMFPYPSGAGLHVGHPRGYTATDILSRFYRMNGYSVLHPMGWDAFGLPAENAAIKSKKNPMDIVPHNIDNFRRQLQMLGFSYDWSREFSTTDPSYYKWTQWLFIQFYKMGLLYKKNTPINFCPFCKTGLAEEEVLPNGTHERCGTTITKKDLPQWIFRITTYGDRLIEDLKLLEWPQGILEMQKNWIGKKEGINITYDIKDSDVKITCFTTTPVNFGATFIVVAPEYKDLASLVKPEYQDSVEKYVEASISKSEIDRTNTEKIKTGVFTGSYAINHVTGEELPIWVADFVLTSVGTGAVQGCPGHDLRDFEFAHKFGLPIKRVVVGADGDMSDIQSKEQVIEKGSIGKMVNSDFLNGLSFEEAMKKTMDYFEEKGWGKRVVSFHLRDWIFSRQRYWGEPIPMVYCQACADKKITQWDIDNKPLDFRNEQVKQKSNHLINDIKEGMYGWFTISENQLPLELPYVQSYEPTDTGESPLSRIEEFVITRCPHCGGEAKRETDTMPNWAGSCWYFLRFIDPHNDKEAWNKELVKEWFPVDWYVGGAEHAVLHLLYSRFWVKALQDISLIDEPEPFIHLRNQGMILAEDHRKMSKSWGNVINPDDVVNEYGADSLRVFEMFLAPFNQEIAWSTSSLQGVYRFLKRIWNLVVHTDLAQLDSSLVDKELVSQLQKTITKVTQDIQDLKYNTAIAAMMELLNEWERKVQTNKSALSKEHIKQILQLLAPFAPFMTEELWRVALAESSSIHTSEWPQADNSQVLATAIKIPIQVNGKVRGIVVAEDGDVSQSTIVGKAMQYEKINQYVEGKEYEVKYIPGKIMNFIVKESSQ